MAAVVLIIDGTSLDFHGSDLRGGQRDPGKEGMGNGRDEGSCGVDASAQPPV
jgi:hypothetical protein